MGLLDNAVSFINSAFSLSSDGFYFIIILLCKRSYSMRRKHTVLQNKGYTLHLRTGFKSLGNF